MRGVFFAYKSMEKFLIYGFLMNWCKIFTIENTEASEEERKAIFSSSEASVFSVVKIFKKYLIIFLFGKFDRASEHFWSSCLGALS